MNVAVVGATGAVGEEFLRITRDVKPRTTSGLFVLWLFDTNPCVTDFHCYPPVQYYLYLLGFKISHFLCH